MLAIARRRSSAEPSLRRVALALAVPIAAAVLGSGTQAGAAFPGTNGKMVFEHNRDIYIMKPSIPSSKKNLTATFDTNSFDPALSPNGKQIVFHTDFNELMIMRSDGTARREIVMPDVCLGAKDAVWSPNGLRIAVVCQVANVVPPQEDVFTVKPDGTVLKRNSKTHFAAFPAWSPSGTRIAYIDSCRVMSASAAGGGVGTVVNDEPGQFGCWDRVEWSPAGDHLLVTKNLGGVFTMPTSNANFQDELLVDGVKLEPAYSPDGTKIVFAMNTEEKPDYDLYTLSSDGTGQPRRLSGLSANERNPYWAPVPPA